MTLTIAQEDPLGAESRKLLEGSETALREVYTRDECFSFTPEELTEPGIRFFIARQDGTPVGCVALCERQGYAEIKRLYVIPKAQGRGVGRALMAHLETAARAAGLTVIRLETGERLAAGVALYRALGYAERGPFGDYAAHPTSLFMEKRL